MKAAFEALNHVVASGIIEDYAIGGAIGASFYLPALQTEDVDAFVFLPPSDSPFVSLTSVYEAMQSLGGVIEGAHIRFGSWPLQILTDGRPLIAEAIRRAVSVDLEGTPVKVFRAEYLCAIALQTGRAKDFLRVRMFLDERAVDRTALDTLLMRFSLSDRLTKATNLP